MLKRCLELTFAVRRRVLPSLLLRCLVALAVLSGSGGLAAPAAADDDGGAYIRRPKYIIEEYHLVIKGHEAAAIDYYRQKVLPVLRTYPGYIGFSVLTPVADPALVADPKLRAVVGLPETPILPHQGVMMDGAVRTDRQIHFHSLLKNCYTLIFHHYIADDSTMSSLVDHDKADPLAAESLSAKWNKMYGTKIWDELAKEYFVNYRNHYDVVYLYTDVERGAK